MVIEREGDLTMSTGLPRPNGYLPGDAIRFRYRGTMLAGTIARAARVSATVEAENGSRLRVPWRMIERAEPAAAGKLPAVAALAGELLARHGLVAWRFAFDHAKRRGGACHFGRHTISVAVGFAQAADDAEIRDTLLHEIAHALVGPRHHHDAVWQAKAHEIGCSARRCHSLDFSEPSVIARCANGCFAVGKHRRRRNMRCRRCGGPVRYDPVGAPARVAAAQVRSRSMATENG